ncbi:uncharacterized protein B0T23DRAFT_14919 [Neurospora hispaniola]|uniref:Uncharacterized protein n=1 Tax=Neurospora hispaniola TaxID=588809 RepID=A0AAJ0IGB7_9PEZI|nr:hypothetical protein B0T23DRAFT_14919 [Neurospora hispaniola]
MSLAIAPTTLFVSLRRSLLVFFFFFFSPLRHSKKRRGELAGRLSAAVEIDGCSWSNSASRWRLTGYLTWQYPQTALRRQEEKRSISCTKP